MLDWFHVLAVVILSAIGSLSGSFLASYFKKKGENLATREDIEVLTRVTEAVKEEFTQASQAAEHGRRVILERLKGIEGLRVLAGPDRLKAHQQAFTMWQKLATTDSRDDAYWRECMAWWLSNCLYLDGKARGAFTDAVSNFATRRAILELDERGQSAAQLIVECGEKLRSAGSIIIQSAGLPALNAGEEDATQGDFGERPPGNILAGLKKS